MINFFTSKELNFYNLTKQINTFLSRQEQKPEELTHIFSQINEIFKILLAELTEQPQELFAPIDPCVSDIALQKNTRAKQVFDQITRLVKILTELLKELPDFSNIPEQQKEIIEQILVDFTKLLKVLLTKLRNLLDIHKFAFQNQAHTKKIRHAFANLNNLLNELKIFFDALDLDGTALDKQKNKFDDIYQMYHQIVQMLQIQCQNVFDALLTLINAFNADSPEIQNQLNLINQHICLFYKISDYLIWNRNIYVSFIPLTTLSKLEEIKISLLTANQKEKADKEKFANPSMQPQEEKGKEKIADNQFTQTHGENEAISMCTVSFDQIASLLFDAHDQQYKQHLEIWEKHILSFIEEQLSIALNNLKIRHRKDQENPIYKVKVAAFQATLEKIGQQKLDISNTTSGIIKAKFNLQIVRQHLKETNETLENLKQTVQAHSTDPRSIKSIKSFIYYLKSKVWEKIGFRAKSYTALRTMGMAVSKCLTQVDNLSTLWQQVITKQELEEVKEITREQVLIRRDYQLAILLSEQKNNLNKYATFTKVASPPPSPSIKEETRLFPFDDDSNNTPISASNTPIAVNSSHPGKEKTQNKWEKLKEFYAKQKPKSIPQNKRTQNQPPPSSLSSSSNEDQIVFEKENILYTANAYKSDLTEDLERTEPTNRLGSVF